MKQKRDRGLQVTHVQKSIKCKDYVYILSNGTELRFKNKNFPTQETNGQIKMLL